MSLAELYNVYYRIHCFVEQPFTSHVPEALHNMARYLIHRIMKTTPPGISKVYPLCVYIWERGEVCVCMCAWDVYKWGGGLGSPTHIHTLLGIVVFLFASLTE